MCRNKEIQKKRFFHPQATILQWGCFSCSYIQREFELHQPLAPAPSTSWRCSSYLLAAMLVYRVSLHNCLWVYPTNLMIGSCVSKKRTVKGSTKSPWMGFAAETSQFQTGLPVLQARSWSQFCEHMNMHILPNQSCTASRNSWEVPELMELMDRGTSISPHTATLSDNHSFTSMPFLLGDFFQPWAMSWTNN